MILGYSPLGISPLSIGIIAPSGITLVISSLNQTNILTTTSLSAYILRVAQNRSVILDFGTGNNTATVFISDSTITSTAKVDTMVRADDTTSDHTANDHKYFPCFAQLIAVPIGTTGIQLTGSSDHKLTGTFKVRVVWSN